jgi:hypothetical protein
MSRPARPAAIDLDDIDIFEAYECVVLFYDPGDPENGPRVEAVMLDVDPEGTLQSDKEVLDAIFGAGRCRDCGRLCGDPNDAPNPCCQQG